MFPTLFDSAWIGIEGDLAFKIPTYFVALMSGFLLASYLAYRDAMKLGIDRQKFIDFAIWMLIVGVLGARFLHVLVDGFLVDYINLCIDPFLTDGKLLSGDMVCIGNEQCLAAQNRGFDIGSICNFDDGRCYPQRDCFRWIKFWSGGLTVYGAFLFAIPFAWFYTKRKELPWKKILDFAGYGIPLGLALGRIGCFAAGCCFGEVCEIDAINIHFPVGSGAYQEHFEHHYEMLATQWRAGIKTSLGVWPTQLISSLYNFIIFGFAYFWVRKNKIFDGQVFLTTLLLYACARFSIEFIRADPRGGFWGLASSQWLAIFTVIMALFFIFKLRKKEKQ